MLFVCKEYSYLNEYVTVFTYTIYNHMFQSSTKQVYFHFSIPEKENKISEYDVGFPLYRCLRTLNLLLLAMLQRPILPGNSGVQLFSTYNFKSPKIARGYVSAKHSCIILFEETIQQYFLNKISHFETLNLNRHVTYFKVHPKHLLTQDILIVNLSTFYQCLLFIIRCIESILLTRKLF